MTCKKCKGEIPEGSLYCNLCGAPQRRNQKKKMYQRPDGLFEKVVTINGVRKPFRGRTESEVMQKILSYQETAARGRLFSEVAAEWKEDHFQNLAYNSKKNYTPAYQRAYDHFESTPIRSITSAQITAFLDAFARQGHAQKTVKTQALILNLIFSYAVLHGDLEQNPAQYVRPPKNLPKSCRELPSDQEIEIVQRSLEKTFGLFAYFLLYTGCRRGEALALQYRDIDRAAKVIHITKSVYYDNNRPMLKTPKTVAGKRDIILLEKLAEHIPNGAPEEYLFGWDGALMTQSQFDRSWKAYRAETGLTLTPHQLRHAFATILFEAGIDEKDAQELLGHTSLAMTRDIYTHIRSSRKEKTAAALNDFVENRTQ